MTNAELERLALLIEECGEVVQAACKAIRHGWDSTNPLDPSGPNNAALLAKEVGHLQHAVDRLYEARDLSFGAAFGAQQAKARSIGPWLHFQEQPAAPREDRNDRCPDCGESTPHVHCPECGATDHVAANCDMGG